MPALRASKAAALQGEEKWGRFHLAVMKAFYTDSRDISSEKVLGEIALESGLEITTFVKEFANPRWETLVYEETREAQEVYGVRSIPAAIVENRYLVEGAVPVSHYREVIARV
jgi:predicted DsbA family dithiol-disulfide isomerase